jgi:hypothetical protein
VLRKKSSQVHSAFNHLNEKHVLLRERGDTHAATADPLQRLHDERLVVCMAQRALHWHVPARKAVPAAVQNVMDIACGTTRAHLVLATTRPVKSTIFAW